MPPRAARFDHAGSTDNISRFLDARSLVPTRFRGTDKFLDVVSWNIRWFDAQDSSRVTAIYEVLKDLNADLLVLTEIQHDGALDEVARRLAKSKAGYYSIHHGTTGGQQRVALMWDRDWVIAKKDPHELFGAENLTVPAELGAGRQDVFPRLPLWSWFEAKPADSSKEGFTFELVGLHLKAQGPAPKGYVGPSKTWGVPQRREATKRLVRWLGDKKAHVDPDVLVIGDWNAEPGRSEFAALRTLEEEKKVSFTSINPTGEASHLVRLVKSGATGSRIDLHLVTKAADANAVPDGKGVVIRWKLFDDLAALSSKQREDLFKKLKQKFSDHLPVVSRFYLTDMP